MRLCVKQGRNYYYPYFTMKMKFREDKYFAQSLKAIRWVCTQVLLITKPMAFPGVLLCLFWGYLINTSFYINKTINNTSVFRFQVCIGFRNLRTKAPRVNSLHHFPLLPYYSLFTLSWKLKWRHRLRLKKKTMSQEPEISQDESGQTWDLCKRKEGRPDEMGFQGVGTI